MLAMAKFEKHIFICTNQRDASSPRGCCNPDGQGELQKQFKERLKARGLQKRFRANNAGCLDQCEHGPISWYIRGPFGMAGCAPPTLTRSLIRICSRENRWSG